MAGSDSESGLRERLRSSTSVLASRGLGVTQMSHAEILSLNLTEKDELISGLRQLYDSSGKAEQVRLLTIAPSNWDAIRCKDTSTHLSDKLVRGNKPSFTQEGRRNTGEETTCC